jgi:hypothetical protein
VGVWQHKCLTSWRKQLTAARRHSDLACPHIGLTIRYRYRETVYHIVVVQGLAGGCGTGGVTGMIVDGVEQDGLAVPLVDDRRDHRIEMRAAAP